MVCAWHSAWRRQQITRNIAGLLCVTAQYCVLTRPELDGHPAWVVRSKCDVQYAAIHNSHSQVGTVGRSMCRALTTDAGLRESQEPVNCLAPFVVFKLLFESAESR